VTLILTYHAVQPGPAPLCIESALFAEHVTTIADAGVPVLTISELVAALRADALPERAVAITFDDGYASVAEHAAPVLAAHGLRATVFCVAGHVGGVSDWPTQAAWAPRLRLAAAAELVTLVGLGWEIGSHGVEHAPLGRADEQRARCEVVESQATLEHATGARVKSFAWPYGARPSEAAAAVIAATYDAACASGPAVVCRRSDPHALPRVDSHYLRSTDRLRRALEREPTGYLALRRAAGRTRRWFRRDFRQPGLP